MDSAFGVLGSPDECIVIQAAFMASVAPENVTAPEVLMAHSDAMAGAEFTVPGSSTALKDFLEFLACFPRLFLQISNFHLTFLPFTSRKFPHLFLLFNSKFLIPPSLLSPKCFFLYLFLK